MTEPVLSVTGLSKSFGGIRAVSNVTFDVTGGELLALIGPNGAGKSTCFNMLMGQLKPDAGTVAFAGHNLVGRSPCAIWRLGVGRTFQITATYPSMTVIENVQMALISHHRKTFNLFNRARDLCRDEAGALLDLVNMVDQAERPAAVLAYGDVKRLELAIALANKPKLLLMDEPTAGMAPSERIELMQLTADIVQERGISVLFTEHDMDVVFAHAHRIMVLNRGELIANGQLRMSVTIRRCGKFIWVAVPSLPKRMMAMLEVSGINSFYGKAHILHDLSFAIEAGNVVALLGRNGAGKRQR